MKVLLGIGLSVIPFMTWPGLSSREPKMFMALGIGVALILAGLYYGELKKCRNPWALLLMGFLFFSLWCAPNLALPVQIDVNGTMLKIDLFGLLRMRQIDTQSLISWRFIGYSIVFFLTFLTISSIKFTKQNIRTLFLVMFRVGIVLSMYACCQAVGADQFFYRNGVLHSSAGHIAATLGQPVLLATFLTMIVPIGFYLGKPYKTFLIIGAILLTHSQVAQGALIISLLFLFATKGKKQFVISVLIVILTVVSLIIGFNTCRKIRLFVGDGGRFEQWRFMWVDMKGYETEVNRKKVTVKEYEKIITDKHPEDVRYSYDYDTEEIVVSKSVKGYPFTGFGANSFTYKYHSDHKNNYVQAHNDYWELAYNIGLIGLFLFLMALFWTFQDNFSIHSVLTGTADRYRMTLLSSFLAICVCAGAMFVFQMGAHIFYAVVLAGLLHNKEGE